MESEGHTSTESKPRLTIDTNCLNAYGRAPEAVKTIERWAHEGLLELRGTERLLREATYGEKALVEAQGLRNIGEPFILDVSFLDTGAYFSPETEPTFVQIAAILFPGKTPAHLCRRRLFDRAIRGPYCTGFCNLERAGQKNPAIAATGKRARSAGIVKRKRGGLTAVGKVEYATVLVVAKRYSGL